MGRTIRRVAVATSALVVATAAALIGLAGQAPASAASAVAGPGGANMTVGQHWDFQTGSGGIQPYSLPWQWLDAGRTWVFGRSRMTLNHGNLTINDTGSGRQLWQSGTTGSGATQLVFQPDGNLVLYTAGYARNVWSTKSYSKCTRTEQVGLALQPDSNFVIYCATITIDAGSGAVFASGFRNIWSTRTSH